MPLTHFPHGLSSDQDYILTAQIQGTTGNVANFVLPYAIKLVSGNARIASGALGTAVSCIVTETDTAGGALFGSITMGASALTTGTVTLTSMSTATLAAASTICIAVTSGTAVGVSVTIVGKQV